MKYMGSKRAMLENGLGEVLSGQTAKTDRFVDLFTGSGTVAWFAARECRQAVLAFDLQLYAAVMAGAVIERTAALGATQVLEGWLAAAADAIDRARVSFAESRRFLSAGDVAEARDISRGADSAAVRAYGGYYFSPYQAAVMEALRAELPTTSRQDRLICQAALIVAALRCAAAPGHTAQPFAPTPSALPFIRKAWGRDPISEVHEAVMMLGALHAEKAGDARVGDAEAQAASVRDSDLVFVDPPYSRVQYSRFYHVLETIARGAFEEVSGQGRYPSLCARPQSAFSRVRDARPAAKHLLRTLASRGCVVIVTYPVGECSNGLSGDFWVNEARATFPMVETHVVRSRFSTLGGNEVTRGARTDRDELILVLSH